MDVIRQFLRQVSKEEFTLPNRQYALMRSSEALRFTIQRTHHDFQRHPGCFSSQQQDIVRSQVCSKHRSPTGSLDSFRQHFVCRLP